ncbi:hypothetical protein L7F22_061442 [Adiantum nelumboides]|nr:hypothetical protein [Adiantum nelumboides]
MNSWRATATLAALLFIASWHLHSISAASAQQLRNTMPLGSSWPARNLSYLTSPAKAFCFGWLQFPSSSHNFYVALIWYAALDNTIVWVANRKSPASDNDLLQLTSDGNLQLTASSSDKLILWQTETSSLGVSALQILDSGNAVLQLHNSSSSYAWQSFSFPTDTLLPSQTFFFNGSLISRPPSFPTSLALGSFKFYTKDKQLASIDRIDGGITVWKALQAVNVQPDAANSNVSSARNIAGQFLQSGVYNMYNSSGIAYSQFVPSDYTEKSTEASPKILRRLTLDPDGNLRMYGWDYGSGKWAVLSQAIADLCNATTSHMVAVCGSYGVCVNAPEPACVCPPGFHPSAVDDVSRGCSPDNSSLMPSCQNNNQSTVYLMLKNTDFPQNDILSEAEVGMGLADCQDLCTSKCNCAGFIYDDAGQARCWLKSRFLNGLQPDGQSGTRNAFIKLWNSTTSPIKNLPSQSPTLAWINSSAFWSQASPQSWSPSPLGSSPPSPKSASSKSSYKRTSILLITVISAAELLCFLLALFLLQKTNMCGHGRETSPDLQPASPGCQAFTYAELVEATNDFEQPLGSGAFGAVFKGVLPDRREVAVKRLQTSVLQLADTQFKAEIAILGRIHHMNLLRLYGYCAEGPEHRLLVYEFMENGSLNSFLFEQGGEQGTVSNEDIISPAPAAGSEENTVPMSWPVRPKLAWKARYNICLGTARGLAYLHEECLDCIVHCDIKPENILLDTELLPRVADFGLAYLFGRNETLEVSNVRGTRGYLAPEWLSFLPITAKADVFSYGMVLIEIVSGRRNYRATLSAMADGRWGFPSWAFHQMQNGRMEEIVDPSIRARMADYSAEIEKVLRIAFLCLREEAIARPTMRSIVQMLEGAAPIPANLPRPGSLEDQLVEFTGSEVSGSSTRLSDHRLIGSDFTASADKRSMNM